MLTHPHNLDRVMVIAPHPDDDVISAAGLIQRTSAAGGKLRILFLTAGESNVWPQRVQLRKWWINEKDRAGWARLRMREAADALARLGARADCLELLGYPDQRLAALARSDGDRVIAEIAARVRDFDPTLIALPSRFDIHSDHRAAAFLAHRAVADPSRIVTYLIHGKAPAARTAFTLQLSTEEQQRKRDAIEAHGTQLLLGRRRFTSYAHATETFYCSEEDLVSVDSVGRQLFDSVRHSAHALGMSVLGRSRR